MSEQALSILITFLLAQVGIEVLKGMFLNKLFPQETLSSKEKKTLEELHSIMRKTDPDGTPLVYAPRAWQKSQKEVLECIREIGLTQKETQVAIKGLVKAIDKLADKLDK
mgnify:CR=1 FL=1